ncbi:hypothetical protein FQR65_LT08706 [Abscondita terminalis]|nr:hypothetical protein FQR65_LT08706 [Abscondita terminalis]
MQRPVFDPYEYQAHELEKARENCVSKYGEKVLLVNSDSIHNTSRSFCSPYWDGILCWPSAAANASAVLECPQYIAGFDKPVSIYLYKNIYTKRYVYSFMATSSSDSTSLAVSFVFLLSFSKPCPLTQHPLTVNLKVANL